jgi:hypothetical protein
VNVGVDLHNLLPLDVGEDHEGVHGSLDVVGRVFLRLKYNVAPFIILHHAKKRTGTLYKEICKGTI